jgi:wyosine [tRNA(Phe)-imidazoG37] synthetase (radical SAM superfamily)
VGKTRVHTLTRKPWVKAETILNELEAWLSLGLPLPEYITLGGKGEPCLNSDMGKIIQGVHRLAPEIPVAVLTNGTLLGNPEVSEAINKAAVVLPSMDTLIESEFLKLNRPCPGLGLETIRSGILEWGSCYSGTIYLEILLVAGINDTEDNLRAMTSFCKTLAPDRIDVVTMTRPGAYSAARPVDDATLARWRTILAPAQKTGSTTYAPKKIEPRLSASMDDRQLQKAILNSIAIRPQTVQQIGLAMGICGERVKKIIDHLVTTQQVTVIIDAGNTFYSCLDQDRE